MAEYFRSVSVRITEPVPGRFYWTIVENLGVATKFNELAAAADPYDTWEEARQAGVAELKRLEPELRGEALGGIASARADLRRPCLKRTVPP